MKDEHLLALGKATWELFRIGDPKWPEREEAGFEIWMGFLCWVDCAYEKPHLVEEWEPRSRLGRIVGRFLLGVARSPDSFETALKWELEKAKAALVV